jgi:spore maturation protein A
MLNIIWLSMIFLAVLCGIMTNRLDQVVLAVTESSKFGFNLALGLTAMMTLWLGIMKVASDSGLVKLMAKLMRPILSRIFPDVPSDHPAMGSMLMSISANLFGLGNAATPFGLQAMKELQTLNTRVHTASDSMCMFVVLNASSLQLIPTTAIAFLAMNGSHHPSSIIASCLICSLVATVVAFISARQFAKLRLYQLKDVENL